MSEQQIDNKPQEEQVAGQPTAPASESEQPVVCEKPAVVAEPAVPTTETEVDSAVAEQQTSHDEATSEVSQVDKDKIDAQVTDDKSSEHLSNAEDEANKESQEVTSQQDETQVDDKQSGDKPAVAEPTTDTTNGDAKVVVEENGNGVCKRKESESNGADATEDEKSPKKAKVVDDAESKTVEETAAWTT